MTRPRDRRARRAEPRLRRPRHSRSSRPSAASRAGPTCSGSPGSATCSAWRRSASSGRSSSSSACRSAASGSSLTLVGGAGAACAAALLLGRPLPRASAAPRARRARCSSRRPGIALAGLLLEALFRSARLQSLQAYDAWAFWVPKAKAIYFFGGLDEQVFTTSAGPTYPPLVPILDAAAFHAMGERRHGHLPPPVLVPPRSAASPPSPGCLHRRAPAWLLWPSLLLVLVVPRFGERLLTPQADVLVDVLFVVGALLLALWLARPAPAGGSPRPRAARRRGAHEARGPPLRGGRARRRVRRVVSRRRRAWPRLARVAASPCVAAAVPWRLWYRAARHRRRGAADLGSAPRSTGLVDSLRLSFDVLFDSSLWSVVPLVAIVALAAALAWGDRRLAAFLGRARPRLLEAPG